MNVIKEAFPTSSIVAGIVSKAVSTAATKRARRDAFVAKFEKQKRDILLGRHVDRPLKSLRGEAQSTLLACPVKLETTKMAYQCGQLTNCKSTDMDDMWGIGCTSQWTPPYPLPRECGADAPSSAAKALQHFEYEEAVVETLADEAAVAAEMADEALGAQ